MSDEWALWEWTGPVGDRTLRRVVTGSREKVDRVRKKLNAKGRPVLAVVRKNVWLT